MSAGNFTTVGYDADYTTGAVHPIRVQPETLDAQTQGIPAVDNVASAAAITNPISAQVSASTRSLGLHARVIYMRVQTTPPATYSVGSRVRIPALTDAFYAAAQRKGTVVTYLGVNWVVTGARPEIAR